jgi:hypothetical protein
MIDIFTRVRVLERDGRACRCCGATGDLCIDHILARSKGGSDEESNLQVLCRRCNTGKGNRRAACQCEGRHRFPRIWLEAIDWCDQPDYVQLWKWQFPARWERKTGGRWHSPATDRAADEYNRAHPILIDA